MSEKDIYSFFARYARQVAAALARADICRTTDSEQCKLRTGRGIAADRGRNLSLSATIRPEGAVIDVQIHI